MKETVRRPVLATASAGEVSVAAIPPEGPTANRRSRVWTWPVLGTIGIFVLAESMVRLELMFTGFLPAPTEIVRALYFEVQTAVYWQAVLDTLKGWALGLGLAVVLAVPIGIIVGLNGWLQRASRFVVDFIRPIPSIAILPVLMLVSGIDPQLKVYMAAIAAFSPMFFQTVYGVQDVDPVALDTARAYRLNRFMRFIFVSLPGATPYIATGLRLAASIALLLVIGTEMVVGLPGLGYNVIRSQYALQLPRMYALVVSSGLLGILIAWCFTRLERVTLKWHPSQRRERGL
jgi:ABC-type nitrate/sulfonate/bicarbonate transport system permease component